jgi:predicted alpha/beta-hydrolase family hydrolase
MRGSAERDQQGLRTAVEAMRGLVSGRMFLGGHSYGGRQASMLAAGEPGLVEALLLLSYPLHPPEKPDQMRTAHFPQLETPALFVSGVRDGFATREEMEAAVKLIPARTELITFAGSGHELATKRNRDEVVRRVTEAFRSFVES